TGARGSFGHGGTSAAFLTPPAWCKCPPSFGWVTTDASARTLDQETRTPLGLHNLRPRPAHCKPKIAPAPAFSAWCPAVDAIFIHCADRPIIPDPPLRCSACSTADLKLANRFTGRGVSII